MGRGYRFGVVVLLWSFAAVIHWLGTMMFGPGDALWMLGQSAIDAGFIEQEYRRQMYFLVAQAAPLMLLGFSTAWLFFSEYEAQTTTVRRGGP